MMLKKVTDRLDPINIKLLLLIFLGSLTWGITMFKSGLLYGFGMGFWGPNGHDGVWHIALSESLARGSFGMPTFSGEPLKNYHIGFDLFLALLHNVTNIPTATLYFQILPVIFAVSIGLLTYVFVFSWKKSHMQGLWSLFFVYFGGSFGWIVTFLRGQEIGGESMFWSQQAISTLINPPFAMSLLVLLLALIFLQSYKKTNLLVYMILSTVFFGALIQIKAYAGILALAALFLCSLFEFLKTRNSSFFKIFLGSFILSVILFLPFNRSAGSILVWQPFWFLETMMGLSDRLNYPRFYEAMVNYRLGNNLVKGIPAYTVAFLIFWFGNLGTRGVKEILVIKWFKNPKRVGLEEVFFAAVIIAGVLVPMLFLQKGTPWNTIQFLYYALFFSGILAGCVVGEFLDKRKNIVPLAMLLAILTIPTTFATLRHYLPSRPPAKISNEELEALTFLSKQEGGVVLTFLFDRDKANEAAKNPPRPLYLYESTAYVSAFSKKDVYLEDQVNLDITGYSWQERRKKMEEFYSSLDQEFVRKFLVENNIKYIYWVKPQRALLGEKQLGIERIFENKEVDVYRVN